MLRCADALRPGAVRRAVSKDGDHFEESGSRARGYRGLHDDGVRVKNRRKRVYRPRGGATPVTTDIRERVIEAQLLKCREG